MKSRPIGAVCAFFIAFGCNVASAGTFSISPPLGSQHSNALGLAVNPLNGNVFLTTLSYAADGGEDNLWEFTQTGTLVNSTRAAFDTGTDGNLGPLVMDNSGNLLTHGVNWDRNGTNPQSFIIDMAPSGATNSILFSASHYVTGGSGLSYDPSLDHLYLSSYADEEVFIVDRSGTLLESFSIGVGARDIVFDPFSGSVFAVTDNKHLKEYARNSSGAYVLVQTYDLASVGIVRTVLAIDVNRNTGLFYAQENNERVVEFDKNSLEPIPVLDVKIDIKPGSTKNPINLRSKGKIPVAILTTDDFDATTVDPGSVLFADAPPLRWAVEDVDSDTDWDLVLKFKTQETDIACGDTEATLTGKTMDGVDIAGTDTLRTAGCKKK
jgi:hypothetical protein